MESDTYLYNEVSGLLRTMNIEPSSDEEDLIEGGLLDSLKLVELLVELEQRIEMKIPVENLELDNFRSIARITLFVKMHKELQVVGDHPLDALSTQIAGSPNLT